MKTMAGIQARIAWELLFGGSGSLLNEPGADYAGILEGMEAAELLVLLEKVQERLKELQFSSEPTKLYIDKGYNIRLGSPNGASLPLRPLVKALFVLFLNHPEGILLKERGLYEAELNDIYATIKPNTPEEERRKRIRRLVDLTDNSFSEKASELNAKLEQAFPEMADNYKIHGTNGYPRRIPLDPLMVIWQ